MRKLIAVSFITSFIFLICPVFMSLQVIEKKAQKENIVKQFNRSLAIVILK